MMNSSLGDLDVTEYYYEYNYTSDSYEYKEETKFSDVQWIALKGITLITCCFGLLGNGYIIWLLGFQIKRNCFTTFILNLAVTDFGYLAFQFIYIIVIFAGFQAHNSVHICVYLIHVMYINTNFLMTAISIDRCVAVIFPIWHRCSRPKHLSSIVCAFLWISSSILCGIMNIMYAFGNYSLLNFHFIVTAIVCLPLITLSTLVLFIKVRLKLKQRNQGRLLLMILITLLCFLILAFPFSGLAMMIVFYDFKDYNQVSNWILYTTLLSCLNSSINPLIYFLVGRENGARSKESLKVTLQKVFKEEEVTRGR